MNTPTVLDYEAAQDAASGRRRRHSLLPGVFWAVVVFVIITLAGAAYVISRPTIWTAEATTMVAPDPKLDVNTSAGYYESLSRGQVVATVAQILQLQRFQNGAADKLGLSRDQQHHITVAVDVVPDTSVIRMTVTAPTAEMAEQMADRVLAEAEGFDGIPSPYVLLALSSADRTAHRSGPSKVEFAGVVILVALVAAIAVQQAVYHLGVALAGGRQTATDTSPAAAGPPASADPTTAGPTTEDDGMAKNDDAVKDSGAGVSEEAVVRKDAGAPTNGTAPSHPVRASVPVKYVGTASAETVENIARRTRRRTRPTS
jgi:capsular polysaccharide biosynthesis protein